MLSASFASPSAATMATKPSSGSIANPANPGSRMRSSSLSPAPSPLSPMASLIHPVPPSEPSPVPSPPSEAEELFSWWWECLCWRQRMGRDDGTIRLLLRAGVNALVPEQHAAAAVNASVAVNAGLVTMVLKQEKMSTTADCSRRPGKWLGVLLGSF